MLFALENGARDGGGKAGFASNEKLRGAPNLTRLTKWMA